MILPGEVPNQFIHDALKPVWDYMKCEGKVHCFFSACQIECVALEIHSVERSDTHFTCAKGLSPCSWLAVISLAMSMANIRKNLVWIMKQKCTSGNCKIVKWVLHLINIIHTFLLKPHCHSSFERVPLNLSVELLLMLLTTELFRSRTAMHWDCVVHPCCAGK